jgi:hemolysin activation/secretion protein
MNYNKFFGLAFVIAGALCTAREASAQSPTSQSAVPTPQQLNPADLVAREARARRNDVFTAPEAGPCPLRDSPLTFTLKAVTFEGATGTRPEMLQQSYGGLIGQTVPVSTICEIRDRATARLFSAGILARVEIPEQTMADGQLRLQVIEAHITNIRFYGNAGPAQAKVEDYIENLRGMAPFDLKVAQRYLLLAADIPGIQISAAVRPGQEGLGAVELAITVSRKIAVMAANVQNYGSQSIGPTAGLVRVDVNGLTPYGDRTSFVAYSTSDLHKQQIAQLIESMLIGGSGLGVTGSVSNAWTRPGGPLGPLALTGNALDVDLSASYPLLRTQRWNLKLTGGLAYVNQKTDFSTGSPLIDDDVRIFYLRADSLDRDAVLGHAYEAEGAFEIRQGVSILGGSKAGANALSRANGQPGAFVARMDGHGLLSLTPWLSAYVGYNAQYARSPLLSYEQLSIGNLTIGRGYDPSTVAGDSGVSISAEGRFGPYRLPYGLQFTAYGFSDGAYVKYVDHHESTTVRSAGGGLRVTAPQGISFDLAYAQPFDKPTSSATSIPSPRLLFSITIRR